MVNAKDYTNSQHESEIFRRKISLGDLKGAGISLQKIMKHDQNHPEI